MTGQTATAPEVVTNAFPEELFVLYTAGTPGAHGLAYRHGVDFPPPGSTWLLVFATEHEAQLASDLTADPLAVEPITFQAACEHVLKTRTFAPEGKAPHGLALVDSHRKPRAFHEVP